MMLRKSRFLYTSLLLCLVSCTTARVTPDTAMRDARVRALDDRIVWVYDSLPALRFDPPFVYSMFKAQVESCTGIRKAGFPALYIAPIAPLGRFALAVFHRGSNTVIFALGSEVMPWVIRHELVHWLLAPRDTKDHPPEFFSTDPMVGRCAPLLQEG